MAAGRKRRREMLSSQRRLCSLRDHLKLKNKQSSSFSAPVSAHLCMCRDEPLGVEISKGRAVSLWFRSLLTHCCGTVAAPSTLFIYCGGVIINNGDFPKRRPQAAHICVQPWRELCLSSSLIAVFCCPLLCRCQTSCSQDFVVC